MLPVWVWPVSIYPTTSPANEEARPRRSMSPASFVSSSDCTLREDDMEMDEMKRERSSGTGRNKADEYW